MKQKPQLNRQSSYSFASPGSHPEQAPDLLSSIEDFHLHDDVLQHSSDEEWEDDICQSEGCPTVSPNVLEQLMPYLDNLRKPVLLWIYD